MQLFYCPNISGSITVLPDDEAHHIFHVLRSKNGDLIQLTNGSGSLFTARLNEVSKKQVTVEIIDEIKTNPRKQSLHIGIAPTKNIDRFEWFLEKATEIGIEKITPILCQRSERKEIKNERLVKVIIAAAKQSKKSFFPNLDPLISFEKFIAVNHLGNKLIAHCEDSEKLSLNKSLVTPKDTLILIGPEGDFSPQEINKAINAGFQSLTLGENRLRTETAAVHACSGYAFLNSEL